MSHPPSLEGLMAKADRACASARLLLDAGDLDGACNRAYYAMFDAARAALVATNANVVPSSSKTHSGLITAFGLRLVKPGLVPKELGRTLNRAEEVRLVADYRDDTVSPEDVSETVEQAESFVAAIRDRFLPVGDSSGSGDGSG